MRGDPRQRLDYELARHCRPITALSTYPSGATGERPMGGTLERGWTALNRMLQKR